MARASRKLSDSYAAVTGDIFKFADAMRFQPTWQQAQVMDAVMRAEYGLGPNKIAVKSGQGPGKTTISGLIGLWRTLRHEDAMTIVTAPTMRQCTDVWLAEVRRNLKKADPWIQKVINITKTKIEIAGRPDWGVKLVTATREENAQGYHDPNMTIIMEEASGIPQELVTQFKGTISNPNSLTLMIGNPNTRDCAFFDAFYGPVSGKWVHITLNAEDTARDYPHIVTPQRNQDLEDEFGRESDVYRIRVLGEFPHTDPNCVISGDDVEKAFNASIFEKSKLHRSPEFGGGLAKQFGIDVARYGGDESVVYRRQGYALVEGKRFVRTDPNRAVDAAFEMQHRTGWTNRECWFIVDAGGMGQGLMDRFYQGSRQLVEFHNGGSSTKPRQYANKATEAWFHMSRLLAADKCAFARDHTLLQQLSSRRYFTNTKGALVLETKDEYMKRGFDSPDRADACILAYWDKVLATGHVARRDGGNVARMA